MQQWTGLRLLVPRKLRNDVYQKKKKKLRNELQM